MPPWAVVLSVRAPTESHQAFHAFSHPVEKSRQEWNRERKAAPGFRFYSNENGGRLELQTPAESTPGDLLPEKASCPDTPSGTRCVESVQEVSNETETC